MLKNLTIRKYKSDDCETVSELFYETVHAVNAADYSDEQLSAWAYDRQQLFKQSRTLAEQRTLIAEINGTVVGFASIDNSGYLDLLFVHKNFLRQGIATALCDELEKSFTTITAYASITAKPFFERRGYVVIREQKVERSGVRLKNFQMQKTRSSSDK